MARKGAGKSHVVRRLLLLSWHYKNRALLVFGFQAVLLAMTLGGLGLTGVAVDVIRHELDSSAPVPSWPLGIQPNRDWSTMEHLWVLGAAVAAMAIVRALFNFLYSVEVARLVHMEMVPSLRARLHERLQQLSFRFFDQHSTGSIINRVTRDVQMLRSFVDGVVIQGAVLLLALCVFLAYMLATHVRLTLVSMAVTPLLYVVTTMFSRWATPAYRENRRLSDQMVRSLAEGIEGILVTKVFGREEEQYRRFQQKNQAVREQQRVIFKNVSRFSPGIDFLNQLAIVVLLGYGAFLVGKKEVTLGDLIVFAGLLQQFASRASNMANIINTLQQSLAGARRVFEILDTPFGVEDPERPIRRFQFRGEVRLENVTFRYGDGSAALKRLSLTVKPGECLGILGATGAGKSTLLSLVSRFYDPSEGRVMIDGVDLREMALADLRRQVGVVFQETLLFRDTIFNNIAFGVPDATREQVIEAAKIAGAHVFIEKLSLGYDSKLEEGAVNLSGGQRQRLAIARALIGDPKVLLLDDPTTAIDASTEGQVLASMFEALAGRTTLLVSNRLSTLARANRILVLEGGALVNIGTADELGATPGLYRQLMELSRA